ncbi:hypothetical protein IAR55_001154 [Kwoniella newhampshirensis]|uniref:Ankyrin n=1 Tax=Kwoniella newhampshirensis TaxID=1651941 RepID=A0AAW0Z528_9TREE
MAGQALATSSRFNDPPPKLNVVRNPSTRVRQAVRDNNVTLLSRLQHKIDLRNTDRNRLTSLSWAAIEGSLEVFEWLLLDYGHDDQELSRDSDNNTILHLLASVPSLSLSPHTQLLRSSPLFPPKPSTLPISVQSTVSLRMTHLYHTLFPFLLDWSNSGGKTALHVAAQAGNAPFISLLCDLGADVDLTDLQGNTPLHYASAWGHLETIRVLLERGCGYGSRNFEGFTASDFSYSERVLGGLNSIAREVVEERRLRRKAEESHLNDNRSNSNSNVGTMADGRGRSGSNTSTSASLGGTSSTGIGSGSYSSNKGRWMDGNGSMPPPPLPAPNHAFASAGSSGYGERTSSLPMLRRGSENGGGQSSTNGSSNNLSFPMPRPTPTPTPPPVIRQTQSSSSAVHSQQVPLLGPVASISRPSNAPPFPTRSPSMPSSTTSLPRRDELPMPVPPDSAVMGSVMRRANSAQAGMIGPEAGRRA